MSMINFTKTALRNLFSKPATENYPAVPRKYPERTRGHVENDIESCIFCGMCSRKCPTGAITVDRTAKTWTIRRMSCIQCRSCVDSCPKKCLSMGTSYTTPDSQKRVDTYTQKPRPEQPKPAAKPAAPAPAAKPAAAKPEEPKQS